MIDDDELRDQVNRLVPQAPLQPTDEEVIAGLRALEDASASAPPQPEPEPEETEPLATGRIILEYRQAVVRRDDQNRVIEIVEGNSRKFIQRDIAGTITGVFEVIETEEVDGGAE